MKQAVLLKYERQIKTSIQGLRRKKRRWLKSLATYTKPISVVGFGGGGEEAFLVVKTISKSSLCLSIYIKW